MTTSDGVKQAADKFRAEIRRTQVILIRFMFLLAVANVVVVGSLFLAFFK